MTGGKQRGYESDERRCRDQGLKRGSKVLVSSKLTIMFLERSSYKQVEWPKNHDAGYQAGGVYLRGGGGDLLPGFGDVLFQLVERRDAQLSLNVCQLLLLGCEHLRQSLDLILNLHTHTVQVELHQSVE